MSYLLFCWLFSNVWFFLGVSSEYLRFLMPSVLQHICLPHSCPVVLEDGQAWFWERATFLERAASIHPECHQPSGTLTLLAQRQVPLLLFNKIVLEELSLLLFQAVTLLVALRTTLRPDPPVSGLKQSRSHFCIFWFACPA